MVSSESQLLFSTWCGDHNSVLKLVKNGVNINCKDHAGKTPLIYASIYGYVRLVEILLEKGANVDLKEQDGTTALLHARRHNHKEIVTLLEEHIQAKEKLEFLRGI